MQKRPVIDLLESQALCDPRVGVPSRSNNRYKPGDRMFLCAK